MKVTVLYKTGVTKTFIGVISIRTKYTNDLKPSEKGKIHRFKEMEFTYHFQRESLLLKQQECEICIQKFDILDLKIEREVQNA